MFVGVDVGTGSARAGLFDKNGVMLASHKQDIQMWRESGGIAEQSSADIWQAVCTCVRTVVSKAGIAPSDVEGLGVDAACSLVVLDNALQPLSISASGAAERNVIVWMDHRAKDQAARINDLGHGVLDYVGGRISPEMQTPKLLWLKENMPETFANVGHFFDLSDYLTWAATGSFARSTCTVTCKWTYLAHEARWDDSYFEAIGLGEMPAEHYARIGQQIVPPGMALANGLSLDAAHQMGLVPGTPVGAGLIDAHAGGVGTVGADPDLGPEATMAYVFGTSACTMASSTAPNKVPGVWGPYFSVMVPGMWLSEGGQSAAGEAIAHMVAAHPASADATRSAHEAGLSVQAYLLSEVERLASTASDAVRLAGARVLVPDLLGNRAPHADPGATGVMSGLTLAQDQDDLLATYVAAIVGVGYGLRQIMEAQGKHNVRPKYIAISGGAGESATMQQILADASGYPILATEGREPVLLGAAMLGAVASGAQPTLLEAMAFMSRVATRTDPVKGEIADIHMVRFEAFEQLQQTDQRLRGKLQTTT